MNHQKPIHNKFPTLTQTSTPTPFGGGGDHMKRSPSELALEALLRTNDDNNNNNNNKPSGVGGGGAEGLFGHFHYQVPVDDLPSFGFKNQQDVNNGFSTCGGLGESFSWYQNFNQQPCVSVANDSQSSICAGSPTSTLKPKAGDNQGSGSSEDEDAEIEAGPCEQSDDHVDVKRIRRMASNRESARRSRRRKQAHLQDLEMQVEQLSGENVTLYKQLTEATQQLSNASTNNRVLKSDVEALRAKVKLAEDMVTRGSLSCSLNQLLQTHLSSSTQMLNAQSLSRVPTLTPTVTVRGQDASFGGAAFPGIADQVLNGNTNNARSTGLVSDSTVSCVSELWPWESQISSVSK